MGGNPQDRKGDRITNVGEMRKLIEGLPDDLKFFTIVGDLKRIMDRRRGIDNG